MNKQANNYSLCFIDNDIKAKTFQLLNHFDNQEDIHNLSELIKMLSWITSRHIHSVLIYKLAPVAICENYIQTALDKIEALNHVSQPKQIKQAILLFYKNIICIDECIPLFKDYSSTLYTVKQLQLELLQTAKTKDDISFAMQNILSFLKQINDNTYTNQVINVLCEKYHLSRSNALKAKIGWDLLYWVVQLYQPSSLSIHQVIEDYASHQFYVKNTTHIEKLYKLYNR